MTRVALNAVFRVNTDGAIDEMYNDPAFFLLNFPSSVAFGTGKGFEQTLYVVNLAFAPLPPPRAALVTIDVGVPGQPFL